ncbi:ORF6N domain-containing protein, partial [Lacrimispora sp.]|uniref:ORF6N domain-containing protein n=1 Tax=Lacrimispora sp. TaxID=2719234 RepID=UPI0028AACEF6
MNKLTVTVNNQSLGIKEYRNQRVVTFKDIDLVHERPDGTAGRNYRENKEHFIEGEDYFFVKPADIQNDEIRRSEINNAGTYLLTEQGYLMLVKSFTDDLAWQVQRQLVKSYFKVQKQKEAKAHAERLASVNNAVKILT